MINNNKKLLDFFFSCWSKKHLPVTLSWPWNVFTCMVGIPITALNFSRTAKLPPTSWLNTTIRGLTSYATFFLLLNCVHGDDISNFLGSQRSQVKASFEANPALWSDPSHTEMYSPVSPQVGQETSVSKQVNWNMWAIIQDCSIPSATRSAAPIISIFFREAPTTLGSCSVFTLIHPHFLVSFCRSTQKHCVMSRLILLPWHLWYWEQYTVCVCTSQMMLRYRTTTLSTHHFHSHSHTFP